MLKEGLRPAAALREAQIGMSRSSRWSSPYYWAGFVIQGEWR
jgi:CHAT domain-containing protein